MSNSILFIDMNCLVTKLSAFCFSFPLVGICEVIYGPLIHTFLQYLVFGVFFFWQLEAKSLLTGYVWFDWQASKKKVYMLYNLEPDRSVTGGAWYSDQDFESEFVEVLNQQCFKYLEQRVSPSEDWYSAIHKLSEKEWTISDEKMLSCIIMYCTCKGYTIHKYIVKCN